VIETTCVLVTGACSGIGRAIAVRCVAEGYRVFGTSRDSPGESPPGVEMLPLDVRDDASVERCVAEVFARSGRLDVLVNNAGRMVFGPVEEVPMNLAREAFDVNFWGVARMVNAVLPGMRERKSGLIINIGSVAGSVAIPLNGYYAATKHALVGYTEALRHEVAHLGVRVALVEPGDYASRLWGGNPTVPARFDDYRSLRDHVLSRVEAMLATAPPPAPVAEQVVELIRMPSPAFRYPVGSARMIRRMRRWMPASMFESGTRRRFGIDVLRSEGGRVQ
jgi:NAD(P)-dependent dehydrogenase (short-subunit alcohol dehydrogenase family)